MRHIARLLGSAAILREGEGTGGGAGTFTAPEGMPAEFVGKDAGETLTKLWGGYGQLNTRAEGLRGELARMPKAPDSADKYTFTPSEKLKPYFGDTANNPMLTHARAAFHKAGIPDAAFSQVIEGIYGPAIEAGLIQPPFDPKAQLAGYGKAHGLDEKTTQAHVLEASNFAKGLAGQLQLPGDLAKEAEGELLMLLDTAAGISTLRALQSKLAASGFTIAPGSTGGPQGEMSDEEWSRLGSDPRIDPRNEFQTDPSKRYDPALRGRYDAKAAQIGRAKYAGKQ